MYTVQDSVGTRVGQYIIIEFTHHLLNHTLKRDDNANSASHVERDETQREVLLDELRGGRLTRRVE